MPTGTVKVFNGEKGYGFIAPDDGGRDLFVHVTAVEQAGMRAVSEGQRIAFEIEPDKKGKGPKAASGRSEPPVGRRLKRPARPERALTTGPPVLSVAHPWSSTP